MKNLVRTIIVVLCVLVLLPPAQAASKGKTAKINKENLVLMPMHLPAEDRNLQGAMETALLEGLQKKYEVFTGDKVDQRRKEVFAKESKKGKLECDETKCLQDIAAAFNSELLATATVAKQDGGYFLAINIRNLFDDKVVYSKSLPCDRCTSFQVVDKLKELVSVSVTVESVVAEAPQAKVNQNDPDAVLWAEAQKGNSAEDYQVYIDTYPKGKYLPFAKARIKKLKEEAQALAEQQEQQVWEAAQQGSSEDSYARYLKSYPTGRFAGLAKVRMDKLKNEIAAREEAEFWKKADGSNDKAAIAGYLNKYPAGRYIASASAKLQAIKEGEAKGPVMIAPVALTDDSWRFEAKSSIAEHELRDVDFRRGENGEGRVSVDLSDPEVGINIQKRGNLLFVDFLMSHLPKNLNRKLDVSDFGTPVQLIDANERGDGAQLVIVSKMGYQHKAYKLENKFIVEIRN